MITNRPCCLALSQRRFGWRCRDCFGSSGSCRAGSGAATDYERAAACWCSGGSAIYYAPPGTVVYPGGQPYYAPTPPPPPPGYQAQPYPPPPPGYQVQPYPQAYGQPMPPPPPVRYEYRRPNRGMLIAGIAILGGSYFLTAVPLRCGTPWTTARATSMVRRRTEPAGRSMLPVFGPWIELRYLNTNPFYDGWSVWRAFPVCCRAWRRRRVWR